VDRFTLESLAAIIDDRANATASASYTTSLLEAGIERSTKKFGEEAVELVIAALSDDRTAIRAEAADVLYHLLVVLKASGVTIGDVLEELNRRTGQSGLEEKASRPSK